MTIASDLDPAETLLQQALEAQRRGDLSMARPLYAELLALDPAQPDALHFLGLMDYQDGRLERGLERVEAALNARPDSPEILNNLGTMYMSAQRTAEALRLYVKAVSKAPGQVSYMINLAVALVQLRQIDEGLAVAHKILAQHPDHAPALNVLGNALRLKGDYDGALDAYSRQADLLPDDPESYYNLGVVLQDQWRMAEARDCYAKAISLKGNVARYYVNHGAALLKLHDVTGAEKSYARALALDASLAEAHYNYAICLFLLGRLDEGAPHYDWRLKVDETSLSKPRKIDAPMWDGAVVPEATILLHSEQGLGDMLQFVRFAPQVAARCRHVIIEVQKPLVPLLSASFPQCTVVAKGAPVPAFDLHCPLMSLMARLGTTLADLPGIDVPYLAVDAGRVTLWREKLGQAPGLKVAIAWQGNPQAKVDRGRSMALQTLAPLLAIEGVRFISLQKNDGAEQVAALPAELRARVEVLDASFDAGPGAFLDSIAVMKACDLVITTDTALAHIAGGIGVPTWLMLRKTPDWRWMLGRPDSPWYPTMQLVRQQDEDDWSPVVEKLGQVLRARLVAPPAQAVPSAAVQAALAQALAHHQAGRLAEAGAGYQQVLSLDSQNILALHHAGIVAFQQGQAAQGEPLIRDALDLSPDNTDILANLALVLKAQGKMEEAIATCRHVLALTPTHSAAHNNLGNLLKQQGDLAAAQAEYEAAVRLAPDKADFKHNLGLCLMESGQLAAAEPFLAKAVELAPQNPDYHFDLSRCLLMAGQDWPRGWAEYEYRRQMKEFGGISRPAAPEWDGQANPALTLLVLAEQGLGDSIQFARFITQARAKVGRIVLVVPPQLRSLMATVSGVDGVYGYGEALPHYEAFAHLPSLPHLLSTTIQTLPAQVPYLGVDAARLQRWQNWRAGLKGRVVGLNWQGNPKARADVGRSLHLSQLAALAQVPDITFVALQKGVATEQMADLPAGLTLVAPPPPFDDGPQAFLDTAALMQVCDLVLTTDTSIAHLAGALGRPAWVMLKHMPDWRWMLERTDYPWYPTMRLFRQPEPGNWSAVIADVVEALQGLPPAEVVPSPAVAPSVTLEQALALHQAGQLPQAQAGYKAVLAATPGNLVARHYLGVVTYQLGDARAAEAILRDVLAQKPDYAEAWGNLALSLKNQQKLDEAAAAFERALTLSPESADIHNNYGNLLTAQKKYEAALEQYRMAIRLQPNRADSYQNMGNALGDLERYDEAIENYRRALALKPDYVAAMNGLGKAYKASNQLQEAIAIFHEATQADPHSADAWSNMGVCYRELRDYDQALRCYDEALARKPDHAESYSNRALALHYKGDLAGSETAYREALRLKPDRADAQFGLGAVLLTQGRWREGWAQYEWRRRMSESGPLRTFPQPMWDGTPQPDKTLFVFAEQGLGDTLQFIRFIRAARLLVGKVIVEVQPGLRRLLKDVVDDALMIGQGEAVPPFDLYAPLMSLPGLLQLEEHALSAGRSYIQPEPELVESWATRLAGKPGLRIGLNWQGNPKAVVDKGRSIPLLELEGLLGTPDTRFICLQKNAGVEQINNLPAEKQAIIEQLGDDFDAGKDAFIDTAAVMANLDLIITTDTAMAHLAGALGRPCWVLLKFMPDWRWMTVREDTPWYPSTRLFRQHNEGDWPEVVSRVQQALLDVLS